MTPLTPTQQAMCAVIRESGIQGIARASRGLKFSAWREGAPEVGAYWVITIDNHTLTEQEYEQWVKRKDSKKRDD